MLESQGLNKDRLSCRDPPASKGGAQSPPAASPPAAKREGGGQADARKKEMVACLSRRAELIWPRGVTVSTLDSESSDRGSNPREASAAPRPTVDVRWRERSRKLGQLSCRIRAERLSELRVLAASGCLV